jgi:hypothetical protein
MNIFKESLFQFSVGSSKMQHQFSVPFFEQQRLFNPTSENDLEAGDDNEVEALIQKVNLDNDFIL